MTLKVGTLCFLISGRMIVDPPTIRLSPACAGRVVEIVGPLAYRAQCGLLMYQIDAPWLRQDYPRGGFFAVPRVLIPISEPRDELPAPPQHEPLTA